MTTEYPNSTGNSGSVPGSGSTSEVPDENFNPKADKSRKKAKQILIRHISPTLTELQVKQKLEELYGSITTEATVEFVAHPNQGGSKRPGPPSADAGLSWDREGNPTGTPIGAPTAKEDWNNAIVTVPGSFQGMLI